MEGQTMEQLSEDIASINATMASIKSLADIAEEVLADGKVDFKDIPQIPALFSEIKTLVEALKGVQAEVKDLDTAEIKEVVVAGFELLMYVYGKFQPKV
jgi:prefoldin subunit 5